MAAASSADTAGQLGVGFSCIPTSHQNRTSTHLFAAPHIAMSRHLPTSFDDIAYRGVPQYDYGRVLGNGSFGIVCEAHSLETGEQVAIKKVLQDPRYKNRELDVMKELHHPNVVMLKDYFYAEVPNNPDRGQRYLNVVMDYVPDTVYRVMRRLPRNNQCLPMLLVRLYAYQMCRSLGYLHSLGICHRDIKPQNLLVDSRTHVLKLCDFGSAKRLVPGEQSVSYICSRFYRAPELMLGATEYTTAIDRWSIGCVLGEMLLGRPLFAGEASVDQLVKIIQILGTPSRRQMYSMNPNYTEFRFPELQPKDWRSVFSPVPGSGVLVTDDALDLLDKLLKFDPTERLTPFEALAHPFFRPSQTNRLLVDPIISSSPVILSDSSPNYIQLSPLVRSCYQTLVPIRSSSPVILSESSPNYNPQVGVETFDSLIYGLQSFRSTFGCVTDCPVEGFYYDVVIEYASQYGLSGEIVGNTTTTPTPTTTTTSPIPSAGNIIFISAAIGGAALIAATAATSMIALTKASQPTVQMASGEFDLEFDFEAEEDSTRPTVVAIR
ncbi:LOW QUALITY PROTEIN: glycogen synthase kinase-3-like [Condylostylus longicornis]|uniref:LOW QUALITY PROTEIN: glycogen synthase kinase-3-like n=1 Tax=Condylostylus longicornis TaxID=2530218 RepID=UPI00244E3493|nr:LOW QUALITY PROTEIN: glycogen synthase kinase-3-like [Condylostylus longicornis]